MPAHTRVFFRAPQEVAQQSAQKMRAVLEFHDKQRARLKQLTEAKVGANNFEHI